jgi:hypothetical protein
VQSIPVGISMDIGRNQFDVEDKTNHINANPVLHRMGNIGRMV